MTEQQAFNYLAAHLPADAAIEVERLDRVTRFRGVPCPNESDRVVWKVEITHLPTGYVKRHASCAETAEAAIDHALTKWRAYEREIARNHVPRWQVEWDGCHWRETRIRIVSGRHFFRDEGGDAREVDAIVSPDGKLVEIAGSVAPRSRQLVLLRALATLAGGKAGRP